MQGLACSASLPKEYGMPWDSKENTFATVHEEINEVALRYRTLCWTSYDLEQRDDFNISTGAGHSGMFISSGVDLEFGWYQVVTPLEVFRPKNV